MKQAYIFLFVLGVAGQLSAQSGCPGCTISLPDSLAMDTIFIQDIPSAIARQDYDEQISFRMPMSTTPVANAGEPVPAGLNITEIEVLQVRNLPPGISWEASQLVFATQEETDGCIRFCGQPLVADSFVVEVLLNASVGILFSQETSVFLPFVVEPATTINDGFTLVDNAGCGSVTTTFINNVPSNDATGFSYTWDFGDGSFSNAENPVPMTYTTPGVYPITYEAIIDTVGYFLTDVRVVTTDCEDIFGGRPDLKINVFDPAGVNLYTAPIVENAQVPLNFPLFQELGEGNYTVQVIDDDSGLGGADDDCGTVGFTRETPGTFTVGGLTLELTIFHPVDTVATTDTVFVYEQPAAPEFSSFADPLVCPEDSITIEVLNYTGALLWSLDSNQLDLPPDQTTLRTNTPGEYVVTYTSPDGCISQAIAPSFDLLDGVDTVQLENFGNVVQVFNNTIPEDLDPYWEFNGERTEETQLRFCATESGRYTLVLTDIFTGCTSRSNIDITVDPEMSCDPVSVWDRNELGGEWSVFPNPSRGPIQLTGNQLDVQELTVTLYNAAGCSLFVRYFEVQNENWQVPLELPEVPNGLYFLRLKSGQSVKTLPIIR
ncbi:MAG: T9SS type A sorting domain-containing protein [Bacteroidota bacterium]